MQIACPSARIRRVVSCWPVKVRYKSLLKHFIPPNSLAPSSSSHTHPKTRLIITPQHKTDSLRATNDANECANIYCAEPPSGPFIYARSGVRLYMDAWNDFHNLATNEVGARCGLPMCGNYGLNKINNVR